MDKRKRRDIHLLLDASVKVGSFAVEVGGLEAKSGDQGEEDAETGEADARSENLSEVGAGDLLRAISDRTGLVLLDGTVLVVLAIEHIMES